MSPWRSAHDAGRNISIQRPLHLSIKSDIFIKQGSPSQPESIFLCDLSVLRGKFKIKTRKHNIVVQMHTEEYGYESGEENTMEKAEKLVKVVKELWTK